MLAEATQDAPSAEIVEPEVLLRHFAKFDEDFFTFCKKGKCIRTILPDTIDYQKHLFFRATKNQYFL